MQYVLVCILGCIMGSFVNMCIYRIPEGESIIYPPSHCDKCGHRLRVIDNIPIISYLINRGRCRYCKEKISSQYPVIELLCSIIFLAIYLKYGFSFEFFKYAVFIVISMIIAVIDHNTEDVYEAVTVCGIIAASAFIIMGNIFNYYNVSDYFYGLAVALILLIVPYIITKGMAMGKGDIQYAAVCALFIGKNKIIIDLFLSVVIAAVIGGVLIKLKKKNGNSHMAFTPYLMTGAVLAIVFGNEIMRLYLLYFV